MNSQASGRVRADLVKRVCMMGFDLDVAEYAALKVNHRSVEAVVDYLIGKREGDGRYLHEFVESKD